ncbi:MAG: 4-hydroxy-tetrahydrodipicolinate reductase [Deltaproteobacteria bacterium]|nr:4-hydroxy-tetrahydrodipicolinate reductase [Deltaproteobacteria bacterium]
MRVVVVGGGGRLGQLIVAQATSAKVAVVAVGRSDDLEAAIKAGDQIVVVDVSTPGSTAAHLALCVKHRVPLVIGTTGLSADDRKAVDDAAGAIPVLVAANLSPGAHLVALLSGIAAKAMADADVEIVEVHHRKKKDAPSGTALMLAAAIEQARGGARVVTSRAGEAPRQPGDIGVVAVRGGDVVGEHTVTFFVDGERVELAHKVSDRGIFAKGALLAARFLLGKPAGRYEMTQVLQASL